MRDLMSRVEFRDEGDDVQAPNSAREAGQRESR